MAMVTSQISHGPYGLNNNPKAPYIIHKTPIAPLTYQKRFPKIFAATIIIRKNKYPEY
jgi:hypothetical protein